MENDIPPDSVWQPDEPEPPQPYSREDRLNLFLARIVRLHGDAYVQAFRDKFSKERRAGYDAAIKMLRERGGGFVINAIGHTTNAADYLEASRTKDVL